jgi:hypothetical protein
VQPKPSGGVRTDVYQNGQNGGGGAKCRCFGG